MPDPLYGAVGRLVVGSGVDSHRADIAIVECAKAIAALAGRDEVDAGGRARGGASSRSATASRAIRSAPPPRAEPHVLRRLLDDALESEVSRKKVEGRAS